MFIQSNNPQKIGHILRHFAKPNTLPQEMLSTSIFKKYLHHQLLEEETDAT